MVLFQRFWRWLTAISRAEWLMADEPSSLGEVVMLGAVQSSVGSSYTVTSENRQLLAHPGVDPTRRPGSAPLANTVTPLDALGFPKMAFFLGKIECSQHRNSYSTPLQHV